MFLFFLLIVFTLPLGASPLFSPNWGFWIDLPEGYEFSEGNNKDRYSFKGPNEAQFDMAVYANTYQDIQQMSDDVNLRLENKGSVAFFFFVNRDAVIIELRFMDFTGWGIGVELDSIDGLTPLLLALAYAPEGSDIDLFHLSALDSIAPSQAEKRTPGPVMQFAYPRGKLLQTPIAGTGFSALIYEHDAEIAQTLIDREFALLVHYQFASNWQEAWVRFYRAIYRDSWDRVANAITVVERNWNNGITDHAFAEKALSWVQGFEYERDLEGSDFTNMVSAATEGRGDCDSRAMLFAMLLMQANIPAGIMVSRNYSHAMGMADVSGAGARFESASIQWLVAETTPKVALGLIAQDMSDSEHWLGVLFD
jgi:hypothetical protein